MLRSVRALAGPSVFVLAAACSAGSSGSAPTPAPSAAPAAEAQTEPTTADGIFTMAQAERGEELFRTTCSECHETVDWTEPGFRGRWEDESVFQLWYYISDRMPYDDPWSLDRQQVTDVLTYILQLNNLPAGDAELGTDDDTIDDYWIRWSPTH
jgi:mono/diheme cytochrome c family protein